MEQGGAILTASLVSSVLTACASVLVARYIWVGKKLDNIYTRLSSVEEAERRCQKELFELRTEMTTVILINDYLLLQHPEADNEVVKLYERMKHRRDTHKTQS